MFGSVVAGAQLLSLYQSEDDESLSVSGHNGSLFIFLKILNLNSDARHVTMQISSSLQLYIAWGFQALIRKRSDSRQCGL